MYGMTKRRLWTKEDDKTLLENYAKLGPAEIGRMLNRTTDAVQARKKYIAKITKTEPKKATITKPTTRTKSDTLCFYCKWATNPAGNPCTWSGRRKDGSLRFKPVTGWTTSEHETSSETEKKGFRVLDCPLYEEG